MSQPGVPTTKTIKLVVPPQYHSLGYQDYTSTLSLSETPSVLKRAGSQNGLQEGMTLLFRGRRITPEEEHISFQDLMKKFGVSLEVEVLVFHCVVHPDAVAKLSSAQKQNTSTTTNSQTDTSTTDRLPHFIPVQSTSASATSTGVQPPSTEQHSTPPTNAPPQQGHPRQPYSISIQGQLPQATQAAIQQTITQLNAQPPTLPSIQVLPIQYQALLINGLPFLAQINRPPHIRLSSDTVIPVTTHEGQQALILSPQGVSSLAQQGYQVEIRVFNRQTGQPAGGVPAGIVGQNQGQQQGQRFGLTDFVSLFRRRLGQQLWLMCKLAFMVGVFSSNNASWRRIAVLCLAAAGIFFWQTGELERWARRFRRPILPPQGMTHAPLPNQPPLNLNTDPAPNTNTDVTTNTTNTNSTPPAAAVVQEGPMAAVTAGLRLAEQVLFVFVASLWPNAVAAEGGAGVGVDEEGDGEAVGNEADDGMVMQ